jgi:integrative and conjugative element protein (TIGR02256 family)
MQFIFEKVSDKEVDIIVDPKVIAIWRKYRQTSRFNKEACGVLIGGYDSMSNQIIVEDCTVPRRGDIRRWCSFILKDKGHQLVVDKAFENSQGKSFYLGTWHSHPTLKPYPSSQDLNDWKNCMARNPSLPCFLFSIVGTEFTYIRT